MQDGIRVGSLVRIPLGARQVIGVVSSLCPEHLPVVQKLRFVSAMVQPEPVLSQELVELAKWVSSYYACSLEVTLGAMIPASVRDGMHAKTRRMLEIIPVTKEEASGLLGVLPSKASLCQIKRNFG